MSAPPARATPPRPAPVVLPGGAAVRARRGALLAFARDPLHAALALTQELGDVVRLGLNGFTLISHPDHLQHVLQDHRANYWRGRVAHSRSGGFFGRGLSFQDGDAWRRQRRQLNPAFTGRAIPGYARTMVAETLGMLARWEQAERDGRPVAVKTEMRELTRDIICATMFSSSIRSQRRDVARAMDALSDYLSANLRTPVQIPEWVPIPRNLRFQQARRSIDRVLRGLIEERRRGPQHDGDLLGRLLLLQQDEAAGPSDEELRDELCNIFVAGHETTANTLAWSFFVLSRMPDVRRRLEAEIHDVIGDRTVRIDDLPKLPYLDRFVREVLRIYPAAWLLVRESYADDCIGGVHIPAGSTLLMSPYVTHHRAELWPNPEGFDPERFTDAQVRDRHRFAWCPFGGGPRVCLGMPFALTEAKVVLSLIVQRYRLELLPGPPVRPVGRLSLEPAGDLPMRLRRVAAEPHQTDLFD